MPSHDNEIQTDFEIVWRQYPRKTAKAVARKAWNKAKPDTATVQKMIDALKWQTQTEQWQRGIIPHMATWINQERWEDERPTNGTRPQPTPENVAQVSRIRERQREAFMTGADAMADEYWKSHPEFRPGKPS